MNKLKISSNIKKLFGVLLTAIICLTLITACESKDINKTPIVSVDKEEEIELLFFNWYTDADADFIQELKKRVNEKYPYITIKSELVNWDSMHVQLETKMACSDKLDLIDFKGQDVPRYARGGNLIDISKEAFLNNVSEEAKKHIRFDGKDYGLPYTCLYQGIFYNKEIFSNHNLSIPKTYSELIYICEVLKEQGITPFAANFQNLGSVPNTIMQIAMVEVFNKIPNWGDQLYQLRKSFMSSSEYIKVFEHMRDIYSNTFENPFEINHLERDQKFAMGEAVMMCAGTWAIPNIYKTNSQLEYGIFPFPGTEPGARLIFEPNHTFSISSNSEYVKECLNVLDLIANDKELAQYEAEISSTSSLIKGTSSKATSVNKDIQKYVDSGDIVDVTQGNTQIQWDYQQKMASYAIEWFLDEKTLDEALLATDQYKNKVK